MKVSGRLIAFLGSSYIKHKRTIEPYLTACKASDVKITASI